MEERIKGCLTSICAAAGNREMAQAAHHHKAQGHTAGVLASVWPSTWQGGGAAYAQAHPFLSGGREGEMTFFSK